jgi:hypothetical protein
MRAGRLRYSEMESGIPGRIRTGIRGLKGRDPDH